METEAEKQTKEGLEASIKTIVSFNIDEIEKTFRDNFGASIDISKVKGSFVRIIELLNDLNSQSFDNIPNAVLSNIQLAINTLTTVESLKHYSQINSGVTQANINGLISNNETWYDNNFSKIYPLLAYLTQRGTDFKELENKARKSVREIEEQINKLNSSLTEQSNQILSEANEALEKVKKVAGEAGVAQHNQNFKEEAENHQSQSKWWLGGTIAMGGVCLGVGSWLLFGYEIPKDLTIPQITHITVTKIFLISTLYYFLIFCSRNYRSHRHNETINKHRCNALKTFEAFTKAASSDQDTKNAVLLQTTQSIFANQHTGYISHETDPEPNKIIEIIRSASGVRP